MKAHVIDLADFKKWVQQEEVVYANSTRERKSLVATLFGGYKVIVAGTIRWQGINPTNAVEAYNAITEKHVDTFRKNFRV